MLSADPSAQETSSITGNCQRVTVLFPHYAWELHKIAIYKERNKLLRSIRRIGLQNFSVLTISTATAADWENFIIQKGDL